MCRILTARLVPVSSVRHGAMSQAPRLSRTAPSNSEPVTARGARPSPRTRLSEIGRGDEADAEDQEGPEGARAGEGFTRATALRMHASRVFRPSITRTTAPWTCATHQHAPHAGPFGVELRAFLLRKSRARGRGGVDARTSGESAAALAGSTCCGDRVRAK